MLDGPGLTPPLDVERVIKYIIIEVLVAYEVFRTFKSFSECCYIGKSTENTDSMGSQAAD